MQSLGGATPLMYACQQCKENEVSEILRKQPHSVKDRDRTLKTPLHYCAENQNTSCAEAILKDAPDLVNAQDENGYCTLHLAVIAGNKPLIKLLIAKGADVNAYDNEGHSAVHWAIVSSEKEALEMIVRAGADPSTPDIHGGYPLHYAVQMCGSCCEHLSSFEDAVRVVETLLNFGVDVNVKDKDGRQPILWASSAGSADAVIHLVSGGACVEAADKDGLTALHCAASRGHTATLETLISLCGANVDVIDGNGCSALFYSVTLGHADATELLLRLGADPNRQDRKGRTPAHCGAAKGQLETLRILQKHGGDLWLRNVKGDIPLHEAVASGRKDLVLWLLSQNSEAINIANNDGRCPLHIASMYNNTEMVKVLLDCKSLVNPVMRTSKGVLMTPLNVALCKGHRSCGKYLQLHGGVPFSKVAKLEPASAFAIRVSPSEDTMSRAAETGKESSHSKISKSRSSTDVQGNEEILKGETTDKKKVYRRRKKKKTPPSLNTEESDTEDESEDLKTKGPENRKIRKNNESAYPDEKSPSELTKAKTKEVRLVTTKGDENAEKPEKGRTSSKPLHSSKSFNETKNVSDLTPEDFPPTMQTITHLDTVIMEPDIDVTKQESEFRPAKETPGDLSGAEVGRSEDCVVVAQVVDTAASFDALPKTQTEANANRTPKEKLPESKLSNDDSVAPKSAKSSKNSPKQGSGTKDEKTEKVGKNIRKGNGGSSGSEKRLKTTSPKTGKATASDRKEEKQVEEFANTEKPMNKSDVKILETELAPKKPEGTDDESRNTFAFASKTEGNEANNGSTAATEPEGSGADDEAASSIKPGNGGTDKEITDANILKLNGSDENTVVEKLETIGADNKNGLKDEPESIAVMDGNIDEGESETIGAVEKNIAKDEPDDTNALGENTVKGASESIDAVDGNTVKDETESSGGVNGNRIANELEVTSDEPKVKKVEVIPSINEVVPAEENANRPLGPPTETPAEKVKKDFDIDLVATETQKMIEEARIVGFEAVPLVKAAEGNEEDVSVERRRRNVEENFSDGRPSVSFAKEATSEEIVNGNAEKKEGKFLDKEVNKEDTDTFDEKQNEENGQKGGGKREEEGSGEEEETEEEDGEVERGGRSSKAPRVSRLCRRRRELKDSASDVPVTQLVQSTLRKYHMERGIFYQLLELKRYQIRSGKANEQVLVKRLADEYERSRVFLGMKPYSGLYKFREFEKFLYDQLKALNVRRSFLIPEIKSTDDIDALSGLLKKSRYKIINDIGQPETVCTCITQRCHHSACAYTSVPCAAYITDIHRHRHPKPKKDCFFPRIEQPVTYKSEPSRFVERPATLELIQGSEKHVITLPQSYPGAGKRYYVTFTIKGAPAFKEDNFPEESKNLFKHRHAKSV